MTEYNQTKWGRRFALPFGSIGLLAAALFLPGCAENVSPADGKGTYKYGQTMSEEFPGVGFDNVDGSAILGFAQTDVHYLHDERLGDDEGVYYYAVMGNPFGPKPFTRALADGNALQANAPGYVYNGYSANSVAPGGTSTWQLATEDGTTLPASTIPVPARPEITSPGCYEEVSASSDLSIAINSAVEGGDAVVMLVYDSYRNKLYGSGSDEGVEGASVASRVIITDDDGNLEIPTEKLEGLATNRVYNIVVCRWRFGTFPRSDGEKVGIASTVRYTMPIILTD